MSKALLVFIAEPTPRAHYIFQELLGNRLGLEVTLTSNDTYFLQHQGDKLSYGDVAMGEVLHFHAHGILSTTGVVPIEVDVHRQTDGSAYLFNTKRENGALPFDPFGASFYLLSRYEEHLPHSIDQFGRYDATQSVAFKNHFLNEPVLDQWVMMLRDILTDHFPSIEVRSPTYRFISTIDIDNAYAYRRKGLVRNVGGGLRDALKGHFGEVAARIGTLSGVQTDPYDTYAYLQNAHNDAHAQCIYFFLLADRAERDKNIPHTDEPFRALIRSIATHAMVGIHPGFRSNSVAGLMKMERSRLEDIIKAPVTKSRQHFIMLSFPQTYKELLRAGITEDHSMGYATHLGFRAGTSIPFLYYDLTEERTTSLRVFPFCCMDGTLRHYMALTPDDATEEVAALAQRVREVGGHFISIWHNESVRDSGPWKGWRKVFENTLKLAAQH